MTGLVGVLGASGRVGAAAAAALVPDHPLRLAGRRAEPLRATATRLGGPVTAHPLDLDDDAALDEFCAGCRVVLHCAAPAFGIGDRVAIAAARAGADYVDVSGDALLRQQLEGTVATPRVAVLGAGVIPGLSALVPRWLAKRVGAVERLTVHAGGMEGCSAGVAQDMQLSLETGGPDGAAYGEPLAAWRGGRRVSRSLRSDEDTTAPFFPGRVAVQPFLSAETQRLALDLEIDTLEWFNVHPGQHVRTSMRRLRGRSPESAVAELTRAADLDLAGRTPYHLMVFAAVPADDAAGDGSAPGGLTALLRSEDSYVLTGFVAALTARAVADSRVAAGVHYACDVLDPQDVLDRIQLAGISTLDLLDHEGSLEEEGAL